MKYAVIQGAGMHGQGEQVRALMVTSSLPRAKSAAARWTREYQDVMRQYGGSGGRYVVVAADGNSSRLSIAMGLRKRDDRPMGVAVRTYYTSPRHDDDYLESWLDLWDGDRLLPGYGWIFGMGDGTSNVGLGLLNTSKAFGNTDYHAMLRSWLKGMPAEWGFTEENRTQPIRGAALLC